MRIHEYDPELSSFFLGNTSHKHTNYLPEEERKRYLTIPPNKVRLLGKIKDKKMIFDYLLVFKANGLTL